MAGTIPFSSLSHFLHDPSVCLSYEALNGAINWSGFEPFAQQKIENSFPELSVQRNFFCLYQFFLRAVLEKQSGETERRASRQIE
jgi:hypothetical protein